MMEKLLLVGAGGFGRVVLEHASLLYECAFVDDGEAKWVDGVPVVGKLADLERLSSEYKLLLVTIGNNALREKIYKEAATMGYLFPNLIHPSAYISPHAKMGEGNILLNNVVVQNNASMGSGCILNAGVELHQDSCIGNAVLIYPNSVVRSLAQVQDRAWIGSTCSISTSALVPEDEIVADGTAYSS